MTLAEARDRLNLLRGHNLRFLPRPRIRRTIHLQPFFHLGSPLFVLNVLAIVLGLAEQGLYVYVIINTTIFGGVPTSLIIMIVTMDFLLPICVQGILLVRLVSVYRPKSESLGTPYL